jgi:hypothetical protein
MLPESPIATVFDDARAPPATKSVSLSSVNEAANCGAAAALLLLPVAFTLQLSVFVASVHEKTVERTSPKEQPSVFSHRNTIQCLPWKVKQSADHRGGGGVK